MAIKRINDFEDMLIEIIQSEGKNKNEEKRTKPQRPVGQYQAYQHTRSRSLRRREKGRQNV